LAAIRVAASLALVRRFRRLLDRFGFAAVIGLMVAFVAFTIYIAQPLKAVERPYLVDGGVRASGELRKEGPFLRYVALFAGRHRTPETLPAYPIDDLLTKDDARFRLSADASDGTRFTVLARYENALGELYCTLVPLPALRRGDEGWVVAETGEPPAPLSIAVDKSLRCG
jgi:hypothetical protein